MARQAKHLSGVGTARMRQAITEGFKGSIEAMKESCGLEPREERAHSPLAPKHVPAPGRILRILSAVDIPTSFGRTSGKCSRHSADLPAAALAGRSCT